MYIYIWHAKYTEQPAPSSSDRKGKPGINQVSRECGELDKLNKKMENAFYFRAYQNDSV